MYTSYASIQVLASELSGLIPEKLFNPVNSRHGVSACWKPLCFCKLMDWDWYFVSGCCFSLQRDANGWAYVSEHAETWSVVKRIQCNPAGVILKRKSHKCALYILGTVLLFGVRTPVEFQALILCSQTTFDGSVMSTCVCVCAVWTYTWTGWQLLGIELTCSLRIPKRKH